MIAVPGLDAFLTSDEAAEALGMCVDELQAQARKGTIPGYKMGKQWRFLASDLMEAARAWRSINAEGSGGQTCTTKDRASAAPRERPTAGRPKQYMTHSQRTATGGREAVTRSKMRLISGSKSENDPAVP